MNPSTVHILETAFEKASRNTQFAKDLVAFVKYLSLKRCPEEKLSDLEKVFKHGSLGDFFTFTSSFLPDFRKQIVEYIKQY